MFSQKFVCPMGKNVTKTESCAGCRKDGTLKNVCGARCKAYKNYVKKL